MIDIGSIIFSGALGLLNYWILRELDILVFFNTKEKTEKNQFIIILGLVNYMLYQHLQSIGFDWWGTREFNVIEYYILTFVGALLIEVLIGYHIKKWFNYSHKKRDENRIIQRLYIHSLDEMLGGFIGKDLYGYVFDFSGNCIEHGYVIHFSTDSDEFNLSLEKRKGHSQAITNNGDLLETLDKSEIELHSYIDFTHSVKVYIFEA